MSVAVMSSFLVVSSSRCGYYYGCCGLSFGLLFFGVLVYTYHSADPGKGLSVMFT